MDSSHAEHHWQAGRRVVLVNLSHDRPLGSAVLSFVPGRVRPNIPDDSPVFKLSDHLRPVPLLSVQTRLGLDLPRNFPQYHRPVILDPSQSRQSTSVAMELLERLTRAKRFFVAVELVVRGVRQVEKPNFSWAEFQ